MHFRFHRSDIPWVVALSALKIFSALIQKSCVAFGLVPHKQPFPIFAPCKIMLNTCLDSSKRRRLLLFTFLRCNCNCWFSHDVTKFQTSDLLILLRFYFHNVWEQLKTNIQTNFHSEWVLGLVIDYAWTSKLLRDVAFTWLERELWCCFKKWLISGNSAIWTVLVLE